MGSVAIILYVPSFLFHSHRVGENAYNFWPRNSSTFRCHFFIAGPSICPHIWEMTFHCFSLHKYSYWQSYEINKQCYHLLKKNWSRTRLLYFSDSFNKFINKKKLLVYLYLFNNSLGFSPNIHACKNVCIIVSQIIKMSRGKL